MQTVLHYYSPGTSPWHRMDARWKLVGLLLCGVSTALLPDVLPLAVALILALLFVSTAGLPWSWWLGRLSAMGVFLILVVVILPLTVPGEGWSWGRFTVSERGLRLALLIGGKTLTILTLVMLLLATAQPETLAQAAYRLGVPGIFVHLLLLTYRYLHVLFAELGKLRIALRLRGYRNRLSLHGYTTIGHVIGTMLVRNQERAERVAQAMRCRGFAGQFRQIKDFQTLRTDYLYLALLLMALVVLPWTFTVLGDAFHKNW